MKTMQIRKIAAAMLVAAFAAQPLEAIAGTTPPPISSNPGPNSPVVQAAGNGIPVVQITTPSGAGVSNNVFNTFNVGPNGLIFNNSAVVTNTQLAGWIQGNMFLGLQPAKVILAQVTAANASQLLGYMEVAGSKADVVVANPWGITCNGCGFINVGRGTLVTGSPTLGSDGSITGFNIGNAQLHIGGSGLVATNIDQLDLLGGSVKIDGPVWANVLNTIGGSNTVAYQSLSTTAQAGTATPTVYAIDVSQLGGMYAGRIYVLATGSGVGVNNAGTIASQTGGLTLSANGDITNTGAIASGATTAIGSTGNISNSGVIFGTSGVSVDASDSFTNAGTLASASDAKVNAGSVSSSGTLAAGLNSDGSMAKSGNLNVNATGGVTANGTNVAAGSLVAAGSSLDLSKSYTGAGGSVSLNALSGDMSLNSTTVNSANLQVNAAGNIDASNVKASANGTISVRAGGALNNTNGLMQSGGAMGIVAGSVTNASGQLLSLNTDGLTIVTGGLSNNGGTIGTGGNLNVAATQSIENAGGSLIAIGTANLFGPTLDNTEGKISANLLDVQTSALVNEGGQVVQYGTADGNLAVSTLLDNTGGLISSNAQDLTLDPALLTNVGGTITHSGTGILSIQTPLALSNAGGAIGTNGSLLLGAASIDNTGGTVYAAGSGAAIATTGNFNNTHGTLDARGALVINTGSGSVNNTNGNVSAALIDLATASLSNQYGTIVQNAATNGSFQIAGTFDNTNGKFITNAHDLTLAPSTIINANGAIVHQGTGTLSISAPNSAFNNTSGAIETNGSLNIAAADFNNAQGGVQADGALAINSTSLENGGGVIQSAGPLVVTSTGSFDNTSGLVQSLFAATFNVGTLTNDRGQLTASQLNVTTGNLSNRAGLIAQNGTLDGSFTISGALDNTGGKILTNALDLALAPAALINTNGTIYTSGTGLLSISTPNVAIANAGGQIGGNGAISITGGDLDNTGGTISGNVLNITAANLTNKSGLISQSGQPDGAFTLTGTLDNTNGQILSSSTDLSLAPTQLINTNGTIQHGGNGTLTVSAPNNALSNAGGTIATNGTLSLSASSVDNTNGKVLSSGATTITSGAFGNTTGTLYAGGPLALTASGAVNNTSGTIQSVGNVQLSGVSVTNDGGGIASGGAMSVASTGLFDNTNGLAKSAYTLSFNAGSLTNSGGVIEQLGGAGSGTVNVGGLLDNTGGTIVAATNGLSVTGTQGITNASGGAIEAAGDLSLSSSAAVTNGSGGLVETLGALSLNGGSLTNSSNILALGTGSSSITLSGALTNSASIAAEGDLTLQTGDLNDAGGSLQAAHALSASATTIENNTNGVMSGALVALNGASLNNQQGAILQTGNGTTQIALSGLLDNTNGTLETNGTNVTVAAGSLNNAGGNILDAGNGTFTATVGGTLNNGTGSFQSAGGLTLQAGSLTNSGTVESVDALAMNLGGGSNAAGAKMLSAGSSDLTLNASGTFTNAGTIASNANTSVAAATLQNTGMISATGNLTAAGSMLLDNSSGQLASGNAINVTAGALKNAGGQINASNGTATFGVTSLDNSNGSIVANDLGITAGSLTNNAGSIVQLGTAATTLGVTGALDNTNGTISTNAAALTLTPSSLTNNGGKVIVAGNGLLSISTAGALLNNGGTIETNGSIETDASSLSNTSNGLIFAGGGTVTGIIGSLTNDATSTIEAIKGLSFSLGSLNNAGQIVSMSSAPTDALSLSASGAVTNSGTIGGNNNVSLSANALTNSGELTAANNLTLSVAGAFNNSKTTQAGGAASITSGSIDNNSGTVGATLVNVSTGSLTNNGGVFVQSGNGAQTFGASGTLDNTNGTIQTASSNAAISAGTLTNAGTGTIVDTSNGSITVASAGNLTNSASIEAAGTLNLNAGNTLSNTGGGSLFTAGSMNITAANVDNQAGSIEDGSSAGTITGNISGTFDNSNAGKLLSNGNVSLAAAYFNDAGGNVSAQNALTLNIRNSGIDNNTGALYAGNLLAMTTTGGLSNTGANSIISSGGSLSVSAASITNTNGGEIGNSGSGATTISASNGIANDAGTMGANSGNVTISTNNFSNTNGGQIVGGASLDLGISSLLNNQHGKVYSNGTLTFAQGGATLDDTASGFVGSAGDMNLNLGTLDISSGQIESNGNVTVGANTFNTGGTVIANGNLTFNLPGNFTYSSGNNFTANGTMAFNLGSGNTFANDATLEAAGGVTIHAGTLVNSAGSLIDSNNTTLDAGDIQNSGTLEGLNFTTNGTSLENAGTVMGGTLTFNEGSSISNTGSSAEIASILATNLYTPNLTNVDGANIFSLGNTNIALDGRQDASGNLIDWAHNVTNSSATIQSEGALNISASTVDNKRTTLTIQTSQTASQWEKQEGGSSGGQQPQCWLLGLYACPVTMPSNFNQSLLIYDYTQTTDQLVASSATGIIASGGDMRFFGDVTNDGSQIAAGNNLYIGGSNAGLSPASGTYGNSLLNNVAHDLQTVDHFTLGYWIWEGSSGNRSTCSAPNNGDSSLPSYENLCPGGFIWSGDGATVPDQNLVETSTSIGASVAAGNKLSCTCNINNVNVGANGKPISGPFATYHGSSASSSPSSTPVPQATAPPATAPSGTSTTVVARSSGISDDITTGHFTAGPVTLGPIVAGGGVTPAPTTPPGLSCGLCDGPLAQPSPNPGASDTLPIARPVTAPIERVLPIATANPVTLSCGLCSSSIAKVVATLVAPSSAAQPVALNSDIKVPSNGLYSVNTSPGAQYLVNTNPLFSNLTTFLSSTYLLNGLNLDPATVGERLGDGFYEQQFIQNEVLSLTGNEFLPGYGDNQDEFKALMNSGETYAHQFSLQVGVGLTADQMAQLTSNMVWLVWENVDGQEVLVPQLYLASNQVGLTNDGAVISGNEVSINGSTTNGGVIQAGDQLQITGANIANNGGSIVSGGNMLLDVSGDINNNSGTIYGGGDVGIQASNVLDQTVSTPVVGNVGASTVYATGVIGSGGNLTIDATNNLTVTGADIASVGNTTLAGQNVTINTAIDQVNIGGNGNYQQDRTTNLTSNVTAGGNLTIDAQDSANLIAAQLNATNALSINANTVNIGSATDSQSLNYNYSISSSGFLSSHSQSVSDNSSSTAAIGSVLSGGTVNIGSVGDTTITGSAIVGTGDVNVAAGGNLTVNAAQDTSNLQYSSSVTNSGFSFAPTGIGINYGTSNTSTSLDSSSVAQVGSNIGSLGGNVTLNSNGDTTITASTLDANQNLNIGGNSVTINTADNTSNTTQTISQSWTGLSLGFNNSALTAATSALGELQQAGQVQNSNLQALLGIEAGQQVAQIPKDLNDTNKNPVTGLTNLQSGTSVSLTFGSSSSSSTSNSDSATTVTSTLTGSNVNIDARDGNVTLVGASVNASDNVNLTASQDINLLAALDTTSSTSSSESSGFSLGATLGLDAKGPSLNASFNTSNGSSQGSSNTWVGTTLNAAGTVDLNAAGNANIIGSQVNGQAVDANIAGNLDIQSLQNSNNFTSQSGSQGLTLGMAGNVFTGSLNLSNSNTNSTWQSVVDQSGLFAGSGGFNVDVGGNTNLIGAVISSTADPSQNTLDSGSLTWSNIQNSANYSATSTTFGANFSANPSKTGSSPSGFGSTSVSGNANGTTTSAISDGTINVANGGSLDGLSRDPGTANSGAIGQIFNEAAVQQQLEAVQLAGQVGMTLVGQIADALENSAANHRNRQAFNDWKEGGVDRDILHGIVGAIQASIGGGNGFASAIGAVAGEVADQAVFKAIAPSLGLNGADQLLKSIVLSGAAGIAGSIGGNFGVSGALAGDMYNRQLNSTEAQALDDAINHDPNDAQNLKDAACYLTECWRGIPPGTQAYNDAVASANAGADDVNEQQHLLNSGSGNFVYQNVQGANIGLIDAFTAQNPAFASVAISSYGGVDPKDVYDTGTCLGGPPALLCIASVATLNNPSTATANNQVYGAESSTLNTQQFLALVQDAGGTGTPAWDQNAIAPDQFPNSTLGESVQTLDQYITAACFQITCQDTLAAGSNVKAAVQALQASVFSFGTDPFNQHQFSQVANQTDALGQLLFPSSGGNINGQNLLGIGQMMTAAQTGVAATSIGTAISKSLGTASTSAYSEVQVATATKYGVPPQFVSANGQLIYPPNGGFLNGDSTMITLQPGTVLIRYGGPNGTYLAPAGTPFTQLSLPMSQQYGSYTTYVVEQPITVQGGTAAPWFGEPGMGTQYVTGTSVQQLLNSGSLGTPGSGP